MSVQPYREWFTFYAFQEDLRGLASIQGLTRYMQEAAGNHAAALGLSMDRLHEQGVAWVLARMRVAPLRPLLVHEKIEVETWPVRIEGLQFRRDFVVRDQDGATVARGVSQWVVVSLSNRKVGRIPAFIAEVALDNAVLAMDDVRGKYPPPVVEAEAERFTARLSDTDRNGHVNNIRYMDWIMDSVPSPVWRAKDLVDLEMQFKAESFHRDRVLALVDETAVDEKTTAVVHSLVRENDGKELVRARSVWRSPADRH